MARPSAGEPPSSRYPWQLEGPSGAAFQDTMERSAAPVDPEGRRLAAAGGVLVPWVAVLYPSTVPSRDRVIHW